MTGRWTQWAWLGVYSGMALVCFVAVVISVATDKYDRATFNLLMGAANLWAARDQRDKLRDQYEERAR